MTARPMQTNMKHKTVWKADQGWAHLGIGMRVGFGCEVVSVNHQLRLRLSMPLSLCLILLGLSHHFAWRLLFCSTCTAVRHLVQEYDKTALAWDAGT